MFKVNNKDIRTTSFGVFIVKFEHIPQVVLVFPVLSKYNKQVNIRWIAITLLARAAIIEKIFKDIFTF